MPLNANAIHRMPKVQKVEHSHPGKLSDYVPLFGLKQLM